MRVFERNDTKVAYETVRELTNQKSGKTSVIEDANGNFQTDSGKIQERWTEYITDLYNYPIQTDNNVLETLDQGIQLTEESEPDILPSEIVEAMRKLKKVKAAGFDNVSSDLLKTESDATMDSLHKICKLVCRTKTKNKIFDNHTTQERKPSQMW